MKKFTVFSGFLGSGKTTAMMALTLYYTEHFSKAAMISNDLGRGVNLADNRFAQLRGCNASEMTEECICYQNEALAERLNSYYDSGCELVVSDIPGFGVGALEHVYHGLTEKFPGQFELAPFTVITEPRIAELLLRGTAGDLGYIYNAQLAEADLIVLNKCDLISDDKKAEYTMWLSEHYPHARIICISALRGEGMEELSLSLKNGKASMRRPDIGYGGGAFMNAMGQMSEYYLQYHAAVCCNDFDGSAYLRSIAEKVRDYARDAGREIPHLKLLAWEPEGGFGKVDLIGTDRDIEINHDFARPCTQIAVVINASAVCPANELNSLITQAVKGISNEYQLELIVYITDCFGIGG